MPSSSDHEDDQDIIQQADQQPVVQERDTIPQSYSTDSENSSDNEIDVTNYESDSSDTLDPTISSDDENENPPEELSLESQIAGLATHYKCTRTCLNDLLNIFRKQGHRLPKDARTLLQTPVNVNIIQKCGGEYYHFGLLSGILKTLTIHPRYFEETGIVNLSFNVDGVPLFKSSSVQFWPLLCSVNNYEPFLVTLFCGTKKPDSVEDYLEDFLDDLHSVRREGVQLNDKQFAVLVDSFICDAPARSFLKCAKGHNAYYGCDRCTLKGILRGRVVFELPQTGMPNSRNNAEFSQNNADYQIKRSPLVDTGIDCIKSFPLDYMHLVCLGVMKRILSFLKSGPRDCRCRLSQQQIDVISDNLVALNGKMPREFARQPRSLEVLDRWKATEYRQCLLYTGPKIFRHVMSEDVYHHFLSLTVAMSILLETNNASRIHYLGYAKELMHYFVKKAPQIYGDTFTTYNIHSLIHKSDDSQNFNVSLNDISAFRFENYLQKLKKYVKKAQNPISQVVKRLHELEKASGRPQAKFSTSYLSTKRKDSCILLNDQSFAFVKEKKDNGNFLCEVFSQHRLENLYTNLCDSKLINVAIIRNTTLHRYGRQKIIKRHDIDRKVACLPYNGRDFVLFPLLHGIEKQF